MAHLENLLNTAEGRRYVTHRLVEALDANKEIRRSLPSVDDEVMRRAHLVLHISKSRETDQGWLVLLNPPEKPEVPGGRLIHVSLDDLNDLNTALRAHKARNEELEKSYTKIEGENAALRARIESLGASNSSLCEEIKQLRRDFDSISALKEALEKKFEKKVISRQKEIRGLKSKVSMLEFDKSEERRLKKELRRELARARQGFMEVPRAVRWWSRFCADTRQRVYINMGCTHDNESPINSAKNSAKAILEWAAKGFELDRKSEEDLFNLLLDENDRLRYRTQKAAEFLKGPKPEPLPMDTFWCAGCSEKFTSVALRDDDPLPLCPFCGNYTNVKTYEDELARDT